MAMNRYFISNIINFPGDVQVDAATLAAHVYLDGVQERVLGLGDGIVEDEFAVGQFRYVISNYEIGLMSVSGDAEIRWFAHVGGVEVAPFPTIDTVAIDTQIAGSFLAVTAHTPAQDAVDVETRGQLEITFSEDIRVGSVDASSATLRIKGTNTLEPISAYINPSNAAQLIIKPRARMSDSLTYELRLPTNIVYGDSGTRLEEAFVLTFTTGVDSYSTVNQVTADGVVERAAPLNIVDPDATPSGAVTLVSSAPADHGCNFTGQQLVMTFSEDLDPDSDVTLTFEFEPLFLRSFYYVNGGLWGDAVNDPPFPTSILDGGQAFASGGIQFVGNPADGNTITIGDGVTSVTFEFDSNATVTPGNTAVTIAGTAALTMANLLAAIAASALTITATDITVTDPEIFLENDTAGVAGNIAITKVGGNIAVDGMSGGIDPGPTPHTSITISGKKLIIDLDIVPPGNAEMVVTVSGLKRLSDSSVIDDTTLTFITELWPFIVGVGEVRRAVRTFLADDLTDCDIAVLIAERSLDLYRIFGTKAQHLQHCVIKYDVALQLFFDWFAERGLDGAKSLGPFSVSRNSRGAGAQAEKNLQSKYDDCLDTLRRYFLGPQTGIKSSLSALERPTASNRIRTWNRADGRLARTDENQYPDRQKKIPPFGVAWS